ncbi:GNAT family N-acetyltransferase [Curtobacterium flaccumfaciens pv. oortii]|uniref:GNAT family N-acetyltransferase n=1 Tax=Curtobacterium flaccumfaciens TaxID=2035 RepID=UPI002659520C|nr:GNAT family N-acetyltransferase [Curtobacterium flaccumfaciens]MCS5522743.1 GNAT family N-acetyltransferase [Curtobacterium flaccumfaciens pv. oortii]
MSKVVVSRLDEASLASIEAREPPTRNYVRSAYAEQVRGALSVLVAWVDGVPVGSGEVTAGPRPELRNLRVDARYRGRGVGTAIIAAGEAAAEDRGVLRIGVAVDNPSARRLYERLGYVATGEVEEYEYTYVDDDDREVSERESSEYLEKLLR